MERERQRALRTERREEIEMKEGENEEGKKEGQKSRYR